MVEQPDLLKVSEVAERLRVTPRTVRRMFTDGRLGTVRIGRKIMLVPAADVAKLIAASTTRSAMDEHAG